MRAAGKGKGLTETEFNRVVAIQKSNKRTRKKKKKKPRKPGEGGGSGAPRTESAAQGSAPQQGTASAGKCVNNHTITTPSTIKEVARCKKCLISCQALRMICLAIGSR